MNVLSSLALLLLPCPQISSGTPTDDTRPSAELVSAGRAALASGRTAEARELLERARAADAADPTLATWLLRLAIAEGRCESALEGADRLAHTGLRADADYVVGWASLEMARAALAAGRTDAHTGNLLLDGQHLLARALAADPERFADAWPALAEAAWRNGDLAEAERAVRVALELAPEDAAVQALAGRIAFGRYQELRAAGGALAEGARAQAAAAFERCVALLGTPQDAGGQSALADAWTELGHLSPWSADDAGAARAYAEAMAWDPDSVDFQGIHDALAAPAFAAATAEAVERFAELHAAQDPRRATLAWWDGWSHWKSGDLERAGASFQSAVELWPAFTDCWYWLWRIEIERERQAASIEALRAFRRVDAAGLAAQLAQDPAAEAARLEALVAWCADPERHGGHPESADAAFLCELLTELEPEQSRHWNNLGLFLRDQGDALRWAAEGRAEGLAELWSRALAAYERALALEPENPVYVNDTAVILHYYVQTDLERAREMYLQAERLAEGLLARADLSSDLREPATIARRDAGDNLRRLDAWRARVAAGETDLDPESVR